jgi:hypothetical protein
MRQLGHLYWHAPDPENPGQFVTYRISVEIDENPDDARDDDGETEDAPA